MKKNQIIDENFKQFVIKFHYLTQIASLALLPSTDTVFTLKSTPVKSM